MSAKKVTIDDLREKAYDIKATVEEDARALVHEQTVRLVIAGAVVVAVAVSMAYFAGSRRRR